MTLTQTFDQTVSQSVHTSVADARQAVPAARTGGAPRFTQYDLAERQLAAVAARHDRCRLSQVAADAGRRSREQHLDLARRADVLREQHRAIVARTDAQLRDRGGGPAVGVGVAEQPDLVLVEDTLPMQSGEAVVREVLAFSPFMVVVAQVAYDDGVGVLLDAGARAAYARRVPPAGVAAGILGLLADDR